MKFQLKFVWSCFVVVSLFALRNQAVEEPPPHFVYRGDFRPPETVFASGFKVLGDNENLLEHVEGVSCNEGFKANSAFTATTSNAEFAKKWSGDRLWSGRASAKIIHVYKIRATSNFYSSYTSLMKAYRQTGDKQYKDTAEFFEDEYEWVGYKGVPKELVHSVDVYERGDIQPAVRLVRQEQNSHYVDEQTIANSKTFPVKGKGFTRRFLLLVSTIPNLSSCFKSCPPTASDSENEGPGTEKVQVTCPSSLGAFVTSLNSNKGTVWDPVLNGPQKRLLPWKEDTAKKQNKHHVLRPFDCNITIGEDNLKVKCAKNKFYEKFIVLLKAGMGNKTSVNLVLRDGVTGETWERQASEIRMMEGGSLKTHGHTIREVFSAATDSDWWSKINVLPVFPFFNPYPQERVTYT